jgi:pSer/pThr/pTyr-binding forkhead associated (FHA) protein
MIAEKRVTSVNVKTAAAALVRLDGGPAGQRVRLDRPITIVGSKSHAHLRIISPQVSGSHAILLNLGNNIYVRDLMSRTGVLVNERPVSEARLKFGDVVRFGDVRFRFTDSNLLRQPLSEQRAAPGELRINGKRPTRIDSLLFVIGRKTPADLVLEGEEVSKAHAVLYEHDGQRMIRDLESRDGTFVNDEKIRSAVLQDGDVVRIGGIKLQYALQAEKSTPAESRATKTNPVERRSPSSVRELEPPQENETAEADHVFVADPVVVAPAAKPVSRRDGPGNLIDRHAAPAEFSEEKPKIETVVAAREFDGESGHRSEGVEEPAADQSWFAKVDPSDANPDLLLDESQESDSPDDIGIDVRSDLPDAQGHPSNQSQHTVGGPLARIYPPDPLTAIVHAEVLPLFTSTASQDEDSSAKPRRSRRLMRKLLIILLAIIVLAAAVGAAWWYLHKR